MSQKFKEAGSDPVVKDFTVGMVDANEDAVYIVTGAVLDYGDSRVRGNGITAITLAKGVSVSIHLYSDYLGKEAFMKLLATQRELLKAFVAANQ